MAEALQLNPNDHQMISDVQRTVNFWPMEERLSSILNHMLPILPLTTGTPSKTLPVQPHYRAIPGWLQ